MLNIVWKEAETVFQKVKWNYQNVENRYTFFKHTISDLNYTIHIILRNKSYNKY